MLARIFALLPLALAAAAWQCNTGTASCCNSVEGVDQANPILAPLSLVDAAVAAGANVGVQCTSATVIGTGHGCQASQQPTCCQVNKYNGLVNLGCSDVDATA
ncbi:hydrophobin [Chiua virens]|nr:hydrophobin [Chiua virens]